MSRDFTAKADIYLPLYIGDYMADTMHLSPEQHGIYMLLIMHYWRNGGAIKNDRNFIKNVCKSSWKKCEQILTEFFTLVDNHYHHKRIDKEIKKSLENKESRQEKAKKGAAARWQNKDAPSNAPSMPQALPEGMLKQCPSPLPSSIEVDRVLRPPSTSDNIKPPEYVAARETAQAPVVLKKLVKGVLRPETYEKARLAAPGWDVYYLEDEWCDWINNIKKKSPDNPDRAFVGYCGSVYRKRGRP